MTIQRAIDQFLARGEIVFDVHVKAKPIRDCSGAR
jgi:hypothetical protein